MLKFDHVTFGYNADHAVLNQISFQIARGEKVGLIGANGAGKSTLMKAILGLVMTEGRIEVGGIAMDSKHLMEIRKKVGCVIQNSDNQLFMPTVMEDLVFGPVNAGISLPEAQKRAEEVLTAMHVEHLKTRRNHTLSAGEKKMAAMAAILVMQPELLLMDEPSSSLDPRNRRTLIRLLQNQELTRLIATHDLDLVLETCTRVLILNDGCVVADGPAPEILRDRALLESNALELPFCLAGAPVV